MFCQLQRLNQCQAYKEREQMQSKIEDARQGVILSNSIKRLKILEAEHMQQMKRHFNIEVFLTK